MLSLRLVVKMARSAALIREMGVALCHVITVC